MPEGSFIKKAFNRVAQNTSPVLFKTIPDFSANQLKNPIFLIGCGRGGTTLTGRLLDMHRDVANWTEANEIWDPGWYPWRPENIDKPPMEYDPYAFTERWWKETEPRQDEIKAIFGAYQWIRRKPFFMNKTPFNTFRIPYLLQMFPDAKIVNVIRDGRAVVQSYTSKLKREGRLEEWPQEQQDLFAQNPDEFALWIARYWRQTVEEVDKQDAALNLTERGIMIELTYEELCENPAEVMSRICIHCGLDPERFISPLEQEPIDTTNNQKWKERFSPELVEKLVAEMEPEFSQRGYQ